MTTLAVIAESEDEPRVALSPETAKRFAARLCGVEEFQRDNGLLGDSLFEPLIGRIGLGLPLARRGILDEPLAIVDQPACVEPVSYTHLTLPTIYSV